MSSVNTFLLLPESKPSNQWMKSNEEFQSEDGLIEFISNLENCLSGIAIENQNGFYDLNNVTNFLEDFDILEEYYPTPAKRLLRSSLKSLNDWRLEPEQVLTTEYSIFKSPVSDHTFCETAQRRRNLAANHFIIINLQAHNLPDQFLVNFHGQDTDVLSFASRDSLIKWFQQNRNPSRNFHVTEKHGENRQDIRIINNKTISPLRCSQLEAQELLNSAIGPNQAELYNYDQARGRFIVFKWEGPSPQNLYHGYHVDKDSIEIPVQIKKILLPIP